MRTDRLDFELPPELIAQRPLEERSASRLLLVRRGQHEVTHRALRDLVELLPPRTLVVLNDTRVLPARLVTTRPGGGRAELLLLEPLAEHRWRALGRPAKRIASLGGLTFGDALEARVVAREPDGSLIVDLVAAAGLSIDDAIDRVGRIPLPPYIERDDDVDDRTRYQTVYARVRGAVAAPTAGLHLTETLLREIEAAGHSIAFVTLHVGAGTFAPVRTDDLAEHPMHAERFAVSSDTARAVNDALDERRTVLAVGTTVVRALESVAVDGRCRATDGFVETRLLITPGYPLRAVDALLTNFHLPRSTLLALVMALAGEDVVRDAYAEAIRARYRFFSYGDAMLVLP